MSKLFYLSTAFCFLVTASFGGDCSISTESQLLIHQYDKNNDQRLNADEYPANKREFFGTTDTNDNGYVEANELQQRLKSNNEWSEEIAKFKAQLQQQKFDVALKKDKNGDGQLNADEFNGTISQSFGSVDQNSDGYVDFQELKTALGIPVKKLQTIAQTAKSAGTFEILLKAAKVAKLDEALSTDGSLTVFAPTDKAFMSLPDHIRSTIVKDEELLTNILK